MYLTLPIDPRSERPQARDEAELWSIERERKQRERMYRRAHPAEAAGAAIVEFGEALKAMAAVLKRGERIRLCSGSSSRQ